MMINEVPYQEERKEREGMSADSKHLLVKLKGLRSNIDDIIQVKGGEGA